MKGDGAFVFWQSASAENMYDLMHHRDVDCTEHGGFLWTEGDMSSNWIGDCDYGSSVRPQRYGQGFIGVGLQGESGEEDRASFVGRGRGEILGVKIFGSSFPW